MIPCNLKVHVKSPLLTMTLGLTAFQSVAMEFPADRTRTAVFTPDSGFLPPADTTTLGLGYLYNDWHQLTDSHGDKLAPSLALHYSHGVSSRDAVTGDYVTLIATWTL